MPEENVAAPDAANRRWKRLMPLLLLLAGFGAGVLASAVPRLMHRGGEHRVSRGDDDGRRSMRRGGERADRGRSRGRDARDGETRARRFREQLVDRLELDDAQQAQMDAFIEANRAEASAFWDDTYARYRELRLKFREQISEILNESQRETFDALMRERGRNDRDRDSVESDSEEGSAEGVPRGGMRR
ncbi:MAG: hypothetical protein F4228_05750 [Acidobacteria bacterium]|nr:hypothetical protein [Acidobacteriota bacterium]MYF14191.1 hypothetical protein [Acidobacteriota bacterium]MYI97395.1 hypothetical protein [Acidobacteriota bacterium]